MAIGPIMGKRGEGDFVLPANCFRQIIGASLKQSIQPTRGCIGHFWDSVNRKRIIIDMGEVIARPVPVFRAASSPVSILSWVGEGAAQNTGTPSAASALADAEAEGVFSSGSYVIPGQTAMGGRIAQKTDSENDGFEWSIEKCRAELC